MPGDPVVIYAARYQITGVTYTQSPFDFHSEVYGQRLVTLVRYPSSLVTGYRLVAVIEQAVVGPITLVPQVFSDALQDSPVPPAADIFSPEGCLQHVSAALQQSDPAPLPQSISRTPLVGELCLRDSPLETISLESVPTTVEIALQDRPVIPGQGPDRAQSLVELALQSQGEVIDPVSADYAKSAFSLAVQARSPETAPRSADESAHALSLALQARPIGMPWSSETAAGMAECILQENGLIFIQGIQNSPQVTELTLVQVDMVEDYHRPASLLSLAETALTPTSFPAYVGREHCPLMRLQVLSRTVIPAVVGIVNNAQSTHLALVGTTYPQPGKMSGTYASSVAAPVLKGELLPSVASYRSDDLAAQCGLNWLLQVDYPTTDSMLPPKRVARVPQLAHQTTQGQWLPLPWSQTKTGQLALNTVLFSPYDPPMVVFDAGLFSALVSGLSLRQAAYPSKSAPQSTVTCDELTGIALRQVTDYPDKSYSISDLQADLLTAQGLSQDANFPDKDLAQSRLIPGVVSQVGARLDLSFPDKDLAKSDLTCDLIVQSDLKTDSGFPDKDLTQSLQLVDLIAENTVKTVTDYPDKNIPLSTTQVTFAAMASLHTDPSMYEMPSYQWRNKPTVFVTVVY